MLNRLFIIILAVTGASVTLAADDDHASTGTTATATTHSPIYRTTDEHGNVVFTDAPSAGATRNEPVELQQTNTAPPPPDVPRLRSGQNTSRPTALRIDPTVSIVTPDNETTIPMGPGNFSVSVRVSPGLIRGQALQLMIDGTPWGEPQQATTWALQNVFRGAHDLTVAIVDDKGEALSTSPPVRVYVFRPSIN